MTELLLIDLGSLFWRKWFATRSQMMTLGEVVNRVDFLASQYDQVVVCADSPSNWRFQATAHLDREAQYKANRPRKEPEAILTLTDTEERLRALSYPVVKCDGFEADDVIATLAGQAKCHVFIASEDKDLYQLISDSVTQLTLAGEMGRDECKRKFGVFPEHIREMLAIAGDSSDNIAGCPKVGPGKAAKLLEQFGSITEIKAADHDDLIAISGIGETIAQNIADWDPALALELTGLSTDCPVTLDEALAGYVSQKEDDEITFG